MDQATAISLVQQQHELDECAERLGSQERWCLVSGIIITAMASGFLISDIVQDRLTFRQVKDRIVLFAIGLGSCRQSRRYRRSRQLIEEDARQIGRQQRPIDGLAGSKK